MRLFVAVYPPAEALDDVMAQARRLRIGAAADAGVNVRLAARANLHVTVAFLGEVEDGRLPRVEEALGRAVRSWHSPPGRRRGRDSSTGGADREGDPVPPAPLRLRLAGGGRFGRGRFTVLWVGLLGDVAGLRRLSDATRRELRRARLPYDPRPLRPHLTLARPGDRIDRESLDADLRTLDGYLGPSWSATELVLVRSHLGPRPTYDRLASWPLTDLGAVGGPPAGPRTAGEPTTGRRFGTEPLVGDGTGELVDLAEVALRPVEEADLDGLFAQQRDPEAVRMAAFTVADPDDRAAFDARMRRLRSSPEVTLRAVTLAGRLVGSVGSFVVAGDTEITYWLDRAVWGRGVATRALRLFLPTVPVRPLYARVASDNTGSLRVLHKVGFVVVGTRRSYAAGRGAVIEETLLRLG